jgi:hypothetical protein
MLRVTSHLPTTVPLALHNRHLTELCRGSNGIDLGLASNQNNIQTFQADVFFRDDLLPPPSAAPGNRNNAKLLALAAAARSPSVIAAIVHQNSIASC